MVQNVSRPFHHQDVNELLQRICNANSVQEIQQCGLVLVQHVQLTRQRQNEITAQEMKAIMKERDGSVAKVRKCKLCCLLYSDNVN